MRSLVAQIRRVASSLRLSMDTFAMYRSLLVQAAWDGRLADAQPAAGLRAELHRQARLDGLARRSIACGTLVTAWLHDAYSEREVALLVRAGWPESATTTTPTATQLAARAEAVSRAGETIRAAWPAHHPVLRALARVDAPALAA
jgi:hypothetical protein